MFTFPMFRRLDARPAAQRPLPGRRPLVEDLEGRQLLSSLIVTAEIQGAHIGTNVTAEIQGAHIGMEALGGGGVGQHIG